MNPQALLDALGLEGSRFFEVADSADLDGPVTSCPDWTIEDLVRHLGGVHGWVAEVVVTGQAAQRGPVAPEVSGAELVAWARGQFDAMNAAFAEKGPEASCWNFRPGSPQTVAWWYRRQALEAAVHRFDIEVADGIPASPVDAGLAVEGVDELLCDMLPVLHQRGATGALHGTLHLHATDAGGEWWVDFDSEVPAARREHKKADTALRGPASGLYLWVWNRQSATDASLEVFGPEQILDDWRTVRI